MLHNQTPAYRRAPSILLPCVDPTGDALFDVTTIRPYLHRAHLLLSRDDQGSASCLQFGAIVGLLPRQWSRDIEGAFVVKIHADTWRKRSGKIISRSWIVFVL